MLGKKALEPKLFNYVTIEDLVPKNNFYRKVNELLDLRFIYQDCEKYYGSTGKPSIDPVVFFKSQLYSYFENISRDRELVRQITDSLSARLFLGYDLDEQIPWHSTISRTRGIIEEEVFEKVFNKILKKCVEAGLIEGKHQSVDSTLVKANASMDSLEKRKPELSVKEFIKRTKEDNQEEEKNDLENKSDNKNNEHLKILEKEKQNKTKGKKGKNNNDQNKYYISKTDPDSKIASKPNARTDLYYSTHYVVDSKERIITDVFTTQADRGDTKVILESLERASDRLEPLGLKIEEVGADKGYRSGEILRKLEEKNIEAYIPAQKYVNTTGKMDKEKFTYDSEKDVYICPQEKIAYYSSFDPKGQSKKYLFRKKDCEVCPIREKCCGGKGARQIRRSIYEEEYQRTAFRVKTPKGKKAMRLRKINTEPLFSEAKMNHGLRKFMTRGISRAQKNSLLIASVQNLKRLIKEYSRRKEAIKMNCAIFCSNFYAYFNLNKNLQIIFYS